ncbi:hypothetical protein EVAR_14332_1 [Eumeta japonica]|uniref:Uncharacterized protein n=1 Tax=Eumeta variegata TaxID=151549 RepID=A0A4C1UM36_EUMVA|nr:hypothetical protein EVAR_14332_1 [Eumeta japonica]
MPFASLWGHKPMANSFAFRSLSQGLASFQNINRTSSRPPLQSSHVALSIRCLKKFLTSLGISRVPEVTPLYARDVGPSRPHSASFWLGGPQNLCTTATPAVGVCCLERATACSGGVVTFITLVPMVRSLPIRF